MNIGSIKEPIPPQKIHQNDCRIAQELVHPVNILMGKIGFPTVGFYGAPLLDIPGAPPIWEPVIMLDDDDHSIWTSPAIVQAPQSSVANPPFVICPIQASDSSENRDYKSYRASRGRKFQKTRP